MFGPANPSRATKYRVADFGPPHVWSDPIPISPTHIYSSSLPRPVPKIVFASFILFMATLPFEAAHLGLATGFLSVAKLSGVAFIVCFFFYFNPLSGKRGLPPVSTALVCFLAYLVVYLMNGLFLSSHLIGSFANLFTTLTQLLIVFWVSSSLLQHENIARAALLTFALMSLLLGVATLLEMPGFSNTLETGAGQRLTTLDYNPNVLATNMALSAIVLMGLQLGTMFRPGWQKWLIVLLMAPALGVIVQTGSRAGLIACVLGFAVFLFSERRSVPMSKGCVVIFVILGIGVLAYLVAFNPMAWNRLQDVYDGHLSGRQRIHQAAIEMFQEKPIFGWQPVALWQELGRRVGLFAGTRDAHNLFLHLVLEVGLLGAAPFLLGLWFCLRSAWKARFGPLGVLPLAMFTAVLFANLSHTLLTRKPFWLVLALCLAAQESSRRRYWMYAPTASNRFRRFDKPPYGAMYSAAPGNQSDEPSAGASFRRASFEPGTLSAL